MESKKVKQPIPEELKEEQLDAVTGGSTGMSTNIVIGHGTSFLDLVKTASEDAVHKPPEERNTLPSVSSSLEEYRNGADDPALIPPFRSGNKGQ